MVRGRVPPINLPWRLEDEFALQRASSTRGHSKAEEALADPNKPVSPELTYKEARRILREVGVTEQDSRHRCDFRHATVS
jgi:hypothetical protein